MDVLTLPRVLWLVKGLGPGGAERLLVAHAAVVDPRFTVDTAYVVPWKNQLVAELHARGVETICIGAGRRGGARWPWRLRALLKERRYDVVHVHSPLLAAAARVIVRTLRPRPALVTTEHNVWARHARATRFANRATVGADDALLAVSEGVRTSMSARGQARTEVLTHGIDVDDVRAALGERDGARAELGVGDGTVLCVTVANLRSEKDYPNLLAAARLVIDQGAPVRFVAAGQGPRADELAAEHARLGLGDAFRFLGYRDDVSRVLAAGDLFVLGSRHEGLPVAVMEALALGLPVVATAVGGLPEAIRDGIDGVLVPAGDPDALAGAIVDLASDAAKRSAMAAAAAARGETFAVEAPARRIEAVYDEVIARRAARG